MNKNSRRQVLKGLVLSFPAAWSPPIVTSVVLPAHARTSPGDCTLPLTLSDRSVQCADTDFSNEEIFLIDDSGVCPQVLQTTMTDTPVFYLIFSQSGGTLEAEVETPSFTDQTGQNCDSPDPDLETDAVRNVDSTGGASWTVSFTLVRTQTPPSVAITNITLSPV